jgi:chaperone modulatory protein CbpM
MITIDMLPQRVMGLRVEDVSRWIELSWVRPDGRPGAWVFREIDVARVRLIVELRDELSLDEEAMPTVLSLLDQLYETRHQMRALRDAIVAAPPEAREAVLRELPGRA